MGSVHEICGQYVSSSIPKVLMLPAPIKHQKDIKKKTNLYIPATSKITAKFQTLENVAGDPGVPAVDGRHHIPVQTDLYLEELCDKIDETDNFCQTDLFMDRPASPLFVPRKIGVDVATQIWTGDLFDFDKEVQPLLESLVSHTIEQSLVEVVTSHEAQTLREQQDLYEVRRNAELAECIRLQEQEKRLLEERQRRLLEQEEAVKLEEETSQKIAACVYAQNYLSDLLPKVYKRLEAQGYFATQVPEIQDVEEDFWPWLMKEVDSEIITLEASCCLLDSIIEDAVHNITESSVIRPMTPDMYPSDFTEEPEEEEVPEAEREQQEVEIEEQEREDTEST